MYENIGTPKEAGAPASGSQDHPSESFAQAAPDETTITTGMTSALTHEPIQMPETLVEMPDFGQHAEMLANAEWAWKVSPNEINRRQMEGNVHTGRYLFIGETALDDMVVDAPRWLDTQMQDIAVEGTRPPSEMEEKISNFVTDAFQKMSTQLDINIVKRPVPRHYFSDRETYYAALEKQGLPQKIGPIKVGDAAYVRAGIMKLCTADDLRLPFIHDYMLVQMAHEVSHSKSIRMGEIIIRGGELPTLDLSIGGIGYLQPHIVPSKLSIGLNESVAHLGALSALRGAGYKGRSFLKHQGNCVLLDAVIKESANVDGASIEAVHKAVIGGLYNGRRGGIKHMRAALGPERWDTFSSLSTLDPEQALPWARYLQLDEAVKNLELFKKTGRIKSVFDWIQ